MKSSHLRGACHLSCRVQRGGSNLQAQSGVMAGAALVGRLEEVAWTPKTFWFGK